MTTAVRRPGPTGPGLAGFHTLAAKHRIVPVWRELVADTLTPVAAFLQIVDGAEPDRLPARVGGGR